ncbi:MAG: hypothetical protein WC299_16650, partial [Kiritimatiellia bacterium]
RLGSIQAKGQHAGCHAGCQYYGLAGGVIHCYQTDRRKYAIDFIDFNAIKYPKFKGKTASVNQEHGNAGKFPSGRWVAL